jgi:hypothetical protein
MKMNAEARSKVYDEIGKLQLTLDPNPNRGLQYVKERLALCRAMQDRCGELMLLCSRALGDVLVEELVLKMEHRLSKTTASEQRVLSVMGEKEEHKVLVAMVKLTHTLLGRTASDIRLLADMTKEQLKLGEIDPKEAGLVKEVAVADLSDLLPSAEVSPPTVEKQVISEPESAILAVDESGGAEEVHEEPAEEPLNYEDLFGVLNGETSPRVL